MNKQEIFNKVAKHLLTPVLKIGVNYLIIKADNVRSVINELTTLLEGIGVAHLEECALFFNLSSEVIA